ncbi:electron carrier/ protein disulfide oxidoreductase [Anaeramoeba flamelloides]|uniref:Electron carrier/ protein disulfide oxidoreductase n=1 Tax=Anaeramoeba flamelloides TaxID=1746091 RepID=A0AAV8ABT5_9EUKA|nr:electron carrier/ protein disulfide oxidoreductase [Anaeramoeba flamelloides]
MKATNYRRKLHLPKLLRVKRSKKQNQTRSFSSPTTLLHKKNAQDRITEHVDSLYEQLYDLHEKKERLQKGKYRGIEAEQLQQVFEKLKAQKKVKKSLECELAKMQKTMSKLVCLQKRISKKSSTKSNEKDNQKEKRISKIQTKLGVDSKSKNLQITDFVSQDYTHPTSSQYLDHLKILKSNDGYKDIHQKLGGYKNNDSLLTLAISKTENSAFFELKTNNFCQELTNQKCTKSVTPYVGKQEKDQVAQIIPQSKGKNNQQLNVELREFGLLDLLGKLETKFQKKCVYTNILKSQLMEFKGQLQIQKEQPTNNGNEKMTDKEFTSKMIQKQELEAEFKTIDKKHKKLKFEMSYTNNTETKFLIFQERLNLIQVKYLAQQKENNKLINEIAKFQNQNNLNKKKKKIPLPVKEQEKGQVTDQKNENEIVEIHNKNANSKRIRSTINQNKKKKKTQQLSMSYSEDLLLLKKGVHTQMNGNNTAQIGDPNKAQLNYNNNTQTNLNNKTQTQTQTQRKTKTQTQTQTQTKKKPTTMKEIIEEGQPSKGFDVDEWDEILPRGINIIKDDLNKNKKKNKNRKIKRKKKHTSKTCLKKETILQKEKDQVKCGEKGTLLVTNEHQFKPNKIKKNCSGSMSCNSLFSSDTGNKYKVNHNFNQDTTNNIHRRKKTKNRMIAKRGNVTFILQKTPSPQFIRNKPQISEDIKITSLKTKKKTKTKTKLKPKSMTKPKSITKSKPKPKSNSKKRNKTNQEFKYQELEKRKLLRTKKKKLNRKNSKRTISLVTEKERDQNNFEVSSLSKLLSIPIGISLFQEYLCEQFNQENIMFWQDVKSFKQHCITKKQISKTAKQIISKFIQNESLFEINIDYECRTQILDQLEKKDFSIDMFDQAHEIVFNHLYLNSFDNFKLSNYYKTLIRLLKKDSTIDLLSSKKICKLIFRNQQKKALNDYPVTLKEVRNGYEVVEELFTNILDLINIFYCVSTNEINFKQISKSIHFRKFVQLTSSLKNINLKKLNRNERICFFLNIYNTLTLHSFMVNGIPKDRTSFVKFMKTSIYQINNDFFSLNDILHGILRGNTHPKHNSPYFFLERDERKRYSIKPLDPRIHFCIINPNFPSYVNIYHSNTIDDTLNKITKSVLNPLITVENHKKIFLPKLFNQYNLDFGGSDNIFNFISKFLQKNNHKLKYLSKSNTIIKFTNKNIKNPQIKFNFNYSLKKINFLR